MKQPASSIRAAQRFPVAMVVAILAGASATAASAQDAVEIRSVDGVGGEQTRFSVTSGAAAQVRLFTTFNAQGNAITGLPAPAVPSDAATKAYVDSLAGGGDRWVGIADGSGALQFSASGADIFRAAAAAGGGLSVTFNAAAKSFSYSVAAGGVTNAMLVNPSLTVSAGAGLSGGGTVPLGGTTSLAVAFAGSGSAVAAARSDHDHGGLYMPAGTDNWVNTAGDTMTGTLTLPSNALVAGGTQLVLSGNNVGIGTAAPAAKLNVVGGNLRLDGGMLFVGNRGDDISDLRMLGLASGRETHFYTYNDGTFGIHKYGPGSPGGQVFTIANDGAVSAVATVSAAGFSGSGASLTDLNASNLTTGTVPLARLAGITTAQLSAAAGITTGQLAFTPLTTSTAFGGDVSGTFGNLQIGAGGVGAAEIANGSVTGAHIANGTIGLGDIGQNGAGLGQVMKWDGIAWSLAADLNSGGTVTSVSGAGGLTGAVTGSGSLSIATGGVTSAHVADGTISDADISATAGIAASKIQDAWVNASGDSMSGNLIAPGVLIDDASPGVSPTITQAAAQAVFGGPASNADAWHTHSGTGGWEGTTPQIASTAWVYPAAWEDVVNVSGSGYLTGIVQLAHDNMPGNWGDLMIVIDGTTLYSGQFSQGGPTEDYFEATTLPMILRFNSSLQVRHKVTWVSNSSNVRTIVTYALD